MKPLSSRQRASRPAGLTDEVPLSVRDVAADIRLLHLEIQGPPSIGPGPKLEFALLYVEREPAHVDVAGALEDACRDHGHHQRRGRWGGVVRPAAASRRRWDREWVPPLWK